MATDAKTGQAIFGRYNVGIRNVGSYQVSGWPWITGSTIDAQEQHKITFPYVPKSFSIVLSGSGDLKISFDSTASSLHVTGQKHYITLADGDTTSVTFATKCKEFYISCPEADSGYELIAELTNIPTTGMPTLTGSGITAHEAGSGITYA
jgi:hypothetical protein